MSNVLTGKTILVTGGTGSIGSEITRQVLDLDIKMVIIFSRDEIKQFLMQRRIDDNRVRTVVGDIRNSRSLEDVFRRYNIDLIYHAAAMKHVIVCDESPREAVETNVLGTQNVVDLALKYGVAKMISISTDKAAYPANVMGATKLIAEKITLNGNYTSGNKQQFTCRQFQRVSHSPVRGKPAL
jgi:UDP-N-acetylglucosamine 4,6-dehydratase